MTPFALLFDGNSKFAVKPIGTVTIEIGSAGTLLGSSSLPRSKMLVGALGPVAGAGALVIGAPLVGAFATGALVGALVMGALVMGGFVADNTGGPVRRICKKGAKF